MGELSYRPGLTDAGGGLSAEWKALLTAHSDRFLVGSDTWVNARWAGYEGLMSDARRWLGDLPEPRGTAHRVGERRARCSACRRPQLNASADDKKPAHAPAFLRARGPRQALLQVTVDQLGHLEHRDLSLLEDFLQLGVGVDHRALGLVLQVVAS